MTERDQQAPGPLSFSYYKSVAPMMWVFVALASIELLAGHLLLALWSSTAAWILSAAALATMVWIVALIRSFRTRPVLLEGDRLVLRIGSLRSVSIGLGNLAAVRTSWPSGFLDDRSVLNLALISYPNLLFDLAQPLPPRRGGKGRIMHVAHKLDDPDRLAAALERVRGRA